MQHSMSLDLSAATPTRPARRSIRCTSLGAVALGGALLLGLPALAQAPAAGEVLRASDGHPDLSGTWDNGAGIDFVRPRKEGESVCVIGCARCCASAGFARRRAAEIPAQLAANVADLAARQVEEDPVLRCFAPGVPRMARPTRSCSVPARPLFLYDYVSGNFFRIVPTDGRPHRRDN